MHVCSMLSSFGWAGLATKTHRQIVGQNKAKRCGGNNLTRGLFQVVGGLEVLSLEWSLSPVAILAQARF
jgi:hypothetical protein